jgi:alpha-beta hydrolase superfamily lysophospholipase
VIARRKLGIGAAVVVLVIALAGLLPPVQARVKAIAVLADALGASFPRPFAANVHRIEIDLSAVEGDLYDPGVRAPAVLLIPGATERGRDDPRVVRLARALARAERVVFVPELTLYEQRLVEGDVESIVVAADALATDERTTGSVAMLGISYGGSLGLLAAADDRLDGRLDQVATFGAYFDLIGVIQAVTTGVSLVDGERIAYDSEPDAEEILSDVAVDLAPKRVRPVLRDALRGEIPSRRLPDRALSIHRLLTNEDPTRTYELAREVPRRMRDLIERFSPSSYADAIDAPVVAMHSKDDPAVPYGEALRLERGLNDVRLISVSIFRHVDLNEGELRWQSAIGDLIKAWRFTSWLLAAQE